MCAHVFFFAFVKPASLAALWMCLPGSDKRLKVLDNFSYDHTRAPNGKNIKHTKRKKVTGENIRTK